VPLVVGDTTPSTLTFEFKESASGSGPDMIFERYSLPIDELVTLVHMRIFSSLNLIKKNIFKHA
jgi:Lipoprotein amino terminal region